MALQFPSNPTDGQQVTLNGKVWRYNATTGLWTVPTVSSTQSVALARTEITATAGQTVLNVTYNTSYGVDVSVNGIQLLSTDYTATNGTSITMTEALAAGDQVVVMAATGAPGGVDLTAVEGDIIPATNETQDLGSATNRWKDLYLSGNSIDLGGATITSDGSAVTLPAGSSVGSTPLGGVQVYADVDALVASSPANGALGFVSANNRLYMYTGAGWFNIALINTSPTITQGGAGSYLLATDGTPTVITLVAEDPEGLPITWSYTAVALENHATISQVDNVFTITPSTNSADAGEFTITFTASDGVNIATDVNSFSLLFLTALWNDVVLSIGTNSTNGLNNSTFIDRSTNAHTVTPTGSPIQTAFHPYLENWSVYFDGSADWLQTASSNVTDMGTGDFTIECWFYRTAAAGNSFHDIILSNREDASFTAGEWSVYVDPTDGGSFGFQANNASIVSGGTCVTGQWHHIAVVRSSGTITLYVDGVSVGTASNTSQIGTASKILNVGAFGDGGYKCEGYVSNVRLVNGTAVYTSAFTVSLEKLTAVSGTTFLGLQSNRFIDNSSNNISLTVNGTPEVSAYSPFGQGSEYTSGENKGSLAFTENNNLSVSGSIVDIGTGDYTAEFWSYGILEPNIILDMRVSNTNTTGAMLQSFSTGYRYQSSTSVTASNGPDPSIKQWLHIAVVRQSGTVTIYSNGVPEQLFTGDATNFTASSISIGVNNIGTFDCTEGYISDLRITKGTALYTTAFTPPTAPVGNTNASLYLPMDNAGIFDKAGNTTLTLAGNASTSTTQTKFADTAMYFDGSGDGADFGDQSTLKFLHDRTCDYTIEGWIYPTNITGRRPILMTGAASASSGALLELNGSSIEYTIYRGVSGSFTNTLGGTAVINQWQHVAIAVQGTNIRTFLDGTLINTSTWALAPSTAITQVVPSIGRDNASSTVGDFLGYIENFQILKGVAKYTTNFTPPTQTQGRVYQAES